METWDDTGLTLDQFIGIEKNHKYCKIAEERLAQGVL